LPKAPLPRANAASGDAIRTRLRACWLFPFTTIVDAAVATHEMRTNDGMVTAKSGAPGHHDRLSVGDEGRQVSFSEGQVLDGKYVIRRRIADGGMSTVYLGVNQRIGKDVAVKVLHPGVAQDAELVNRFEREACIVSRIRSANVADVYDFGELPSGQCFMVMEYLDGESLARKLDREGTIPAPTLAMIAEQILVALSAAHEAGVVHRDLKPENVLLTQRAGEITAKVVDFGISKVLPRSPWHDMQHPQYAGDVASKVDVKLTSFNSVLGTPLYMSPEQAQGNSGKIDERTDIYALGVILYEATSGEMPLTGDNVNELLLRIVLDEPEPLESRAPAVDPGWSAIVSKALAKNPAYRYQSADAMREAIRAWSLGQQTTFTRSTVPRFGPAMPRISSPVPSDDFDSSAEASSEGLPISIDGLSTSSRGSVARPSIIVEINEREPATPSATSIRRWPLAALFALVLFGALMAQRALLVSHPSSPNADEPAPATLLRAAPSHAPRVPRIGAPACPPLPPTPGAAFSLDTRETPPIVTALEKP
jgi:eukaryotic-like serine/threonine-protein kinase